MTRRCTRCGRTRQANESRAAVLCRDCRVVERSADVQTAAPLGRWVRRGLTFAWQPTSCSNCQHGEADPANPLSVCDSCTAALVRQAVRAITVAVLAAERIEPRRSTCPADGCLLLPGEACPACAVDAARPVEVAA